MKPERHVVLITGGATGIGFALAEKFLANGNRVIIVGRNENALQKAKQLLPSVMTCVADVSLDADRARLVNLYPDVTVLINNAGIQVYKPIADSTQQEIEHEISVNLTAPILLSLAFLPVLKLHESSAIINVTSGLALVPKQATAIYCATKAALHSTSKSLRWQLEGSPVKVFEVLPPFVETAMTAHRGKGGMKPEQLADEFWSGFVANRYEMYIGPTKILKLINRVMPSFAEKLVRHRV
jgi:uncharacterized oxidoreductase